MRKDHLFDADTNAYIHVTLLITGSASSVTHSHVCLCLHYAVDSSITGVSLPCLCAGSYAVFGFFNYIEDLTVFNLPKDEPRPSVPQGSYHMELSVRGLNSCCPDGLSV